MNNLQKAKEILLQQPYTCVVCKKDTMYTSQSRGVVPLVEWIQSGTDLTGFSAADKVIGKASALLFVMLGITAVYTPVVSEKAAEVFTQYGIELEYGQKVPMIINRAGTGPCPMENAVEGISDPETALQKIQQTLIELNIK